MDRIGKTAVKYGNLQVIFNNNQLSISKDGSNVVGNVLSFEIPSYIKLNIDVEKKEINLLLEHEDITKKMRSMYGTLRQLINNACIGLTNEFVKVLKLHGVGYSVEDKPTFLTFKLGYSHNIFWRKKAGVRYEIIDSSRLGIYSSDKNLNSQEAASIMKLRKLSAYTLKGIVDMAKTKFKFKSKNKSKKA